MEQDDLLRLVVEALERLEIPYLVTGSMATIFYGEPRFTNDIDVVARLESDDVDRLIDQFSADEFYLSREAARRAVDNASQFNLIHPASGLKVDFMVPTMDPFDQSRFERGRRVHPAAGFEATFASPEDVILKKLQYYRDGGSDKHLRDSAGVLKVSRGVDRGYIAEWSRRLGLTEIWHRVEARVDPGLGASAPSRGAAQPKNR